MNYPDRRPDDWPLCPRCGEDELWSPDGTEDGIASCLACHWKPSLFKQAQRRIR